MSQLLNFGVTFQVAKITRTEMWLWLWDQVVVETDRVLRRKDQAEGPGEDCRGIPSRGPLGRQLNDSEADDLGA